MAKAERNIYQLILNRRSIRKFKQKPLLSKILKKLVNVARLAPSGANLQPLEFTVINDKNICNDVFKTLKWAGYILPNGTPKENEVPAAYILVLVNTLIRENNYQWDVGAAMENIILAALEKGIGSCWIGSIDKSKLREILNIPSYFIIDSILALGYPDEDPKIEKLKNDCKYWKDCKGRMHIPKRDFNKVIHFNRMD